MSFNYNSRIVCEFAARGVSGRPGLGLYRLCFHVEYSTAAWEQPGAVAREIRGEVKVRAEGSAEHFLGTILPEAPLVIEARDVPLQYHILFFMELDARRIEAIEELRKGGDLWFTLTLSGLIDGVRGQSPARDHLTLQLNQRAWTDALKQMGYGEYLLFEIPVPPPDSSDDLKQALSHLVKAREHLLAGHYDEVVRVCRLVLESTTKGLGEKAHLDSAKEAYCKARKGMPRSDRFLFLREAAEHVCHLAHHPEEAGRMSSFDRKDAICLLAVTAAVVARSFSRSSG